jgi:hypothetical protein
MWMLIGLYPEFSELDFSLITNFNLEAAATNEVNTSQTVGMSLVDLKRSFFHLLLINSLGSGILIGKLIDGKMKYGLNHSLILVGLATLIFLIFMF